MESACAVMDMENFSPPSLCYYFLASFEAHRLKVPIADQEICHVDHRCRRGSRHAPVVCPAQVRIIGASASLHLQGIRASESYNTKHLSHSSGGLVGWSTFLHSLPLGVCVSRLKGLARTDSPFVILIFLLG